MILERLIFLQLMSGLWRPPGLLYRL